MLAWAALAALGLWYWLGRRRKKVPAQWFAIAGALIGAVLAAKGMPLIGAVLATGSGLWLQYGGTLLGRGKVPPAMGEASPPELGRSEAADLLGLAPDADRTAILAAHKRLIARNHPDAGGSAGLAARINAARDLLLKSQQD